MRSRLFTYGLLATLPACATVDSEPAPFEAVLRETAHETARETANDSGVRAREAGASQASGAAVPAQAVASVSDGSKPLGQDEPEQAPARYRLTEEELDIWNEPAFRRAFALSYQAETEVEPSVTVDELGTMEKVLELISDDRADKALKLLRKNLDDSASAVFDFTVANIHFQAEELDEAAASYRVATRKFPKFRRAWRNLGLIHVRQNHFEPAIGALTRVIELGGGDALTYGLLGFAYSGVENHVSAESAYRMATLLDPATADWREGLALSFFKQERYADAAALCAAMIDREPDNASLWLLQANAFIGLDQPLRAAENFELVDRLGRSTPESLDNLGDIYVNQELFDLGVEAYVRALEASADGSVERPLRAAKVLTAQGALDATRSLVAAIEELRGESLGDEQRKDLYKLQARLAVADGAGDEEARVLEKIVALDPLDGEALILLGQHAQRGGDAEQAIFWYERASAIEAHEADAKVRHAQLLAGRGEYREALDLLRRAQSIKPRDNVQQYLEQVERVAQNR